MTTTTEQTRDEADPVALPPTDGPNPPSSEGTQPARRSVDASTALVAAAVGCSAAAAGVMVGGIFVGAGGRAYAIGAGVLGLLVAVAASRISKPLLANAVIVVGLFAIGLLMVVPSGLDELGRIQSLIASARGSGSVLRPPVPLTPGWQAIIGWLMGLAAYLATWVAVELRKPVLGLMLPLPVAAVAAISVPDRQQVASGLVVLALFAIGVGLLSASAAAGGDDEERLPLAFQVRRTLKAIPVVAVITTVLYALSQANFLFPNPLVDPASEAQKPKTVPITEVPDRVLFTVSSKLSGPWRIGSLDVYDGKDWRLPPFAASELRPVPRNGIVDGQLKPGVRATFRVQGLTGAVLPGLPNPVGIVAEGPRLAYDSRSGNIRTAEGEIRPGLAYTVVAGSLPTVEELRRATEPAAPELREFVDVPAPPPAVTGLLARAPKTSPWDTFDFLRKYVLDNVTATGAGTPTSVPPAKVQDMLAGSKEASPFEIVAAQALLARWVGLPSRIGYGFDGGDVVEGTLEVRPRHGATFVEVYFPQHKWLPVIGTPKKAKATLGKEGLQRLDSNVLASEDISVQVYLPLIVDPPGTLTDQIKLALLIGVPLLALAVLAYFLWPAVAKARRRARRRRDALLGGPGARVAAAYAEWRDYATDCGFFYPSDTPLAFLERFFEEEEHTELAWLVTRCVWGDLADDVTEAHAIAAEEMARSMRLRLARAQPATLRMIAVVSRMSVRYPYVSPTPHRRTANPENKELADVTS